MSILRCFAVEVFVVDLRVDTGKVRSRRNIVQALVFSEKLKQTC